MKNQLLFVYNAKSNIMNKTFDFMHKMVSPHTYNCHLCALTHTHFKERQEWIDFKNTIEIDLNFMYSNNFEKAHPNEQKKFPVVYLNKKNQLIEIVTSQEINSLKNISEFILLLNQKKSLFSK